MARRADKTNTPDESLRRRTASAREWDQIRALYIRGETPAYICKMYPYLRITEKTIYNRMSKERVTAVRQEIHDRAVEHVATMTLREKERVNEKCIMLFNTGAEVIEELLGKYKNELKDNPTIAKGAARATAYNVDLLMSGTTKIQKGLRVAYGMDEDGKLYEKEPEILTVEGVKMDEI